MQYLTDLVEQIKKETETHAVENYSSFLQSAVRFHHNFFAPFSKQSNMSYNMHHAMHQ